MDIKEHMLVKKLMYTINLECKGTKHHLSQLPLFDHVKDNITYLIECGYNDPESMEDVYLICGSVASTLFKIHGSNTKDVTQVLVHYNSTIADMAMRVHTPYVHSEGETRKDKHKAKVHYALQQTLPVRIIKLVQIWEDANTLRKYNPRLWDVRKSEFYDMFIRLYDTRIKDKFISNMKSALVKTEDDQKVFFETLQSFTSEHMHLALTTEDKDTVLKNLPEELKYNPYILAIIS